MTYSVWRTTPDGKGWMEVAEELSKKDAEVYLQDTQASAANRDLDTQFVMLPTGKKP